MSFEFYDERYNKFDYLQAICSNNPERVVKIVRTSYDFLNMQLFH